jgi:hypothetical protein
LGVPSHDGVRGDQWEAKWEVIESSLRSIPFLAALPVPELRAVARGLELVEYRKLDIIVKEGNGSEDGLYVLVRPTLVVAHPVAVPVGRGAAL